jgi:hypothetical protein
MKGLVITVLILFAVVCVFGVFDFKPLKADRMMPPSERLAGFVFSVLLIGLIAALAHWW